MEPLTTSVFNIRNEQSFQQEALGLFHYQALNNDVYRHYLENLRVNSTHVREISQIPFLPIEFFKTQRLITGNAPIQETFTSSGTTGMVQSKHYVTDVKLYEESYQKAFHLFYGKVEDYCILALLPSYLERDGSSLIYMANDLIKQSKHPESGFYLHNYQELLLKIQQLEKKKQKTILLGVTYSLLDIAELFGVTSIHSEYGMTELLSQAYSKGDGKFTCPPWMHILIRDANDPFTFLSPEQTGGINIIDLANRNSCAFIASQDLGKTHADGTFEILGRFDASDVRGCNLLML